MKHFFPFLTIPFILCILLNIFPVIPVYAQQHDSFASARTLSVNQKTTVTIPANASEYYYFHSLQTAKSISQKYQISLSEKTGLTVSVFNDQSSTVELIQNKSDSSLWTASFESSPDDTRYFLILHNETAEDIVTRLSVGHSAVYPATASPKSDLQRSTRKRTPQPHKKKQAVAKPRQKKSDSSATLTKTAAPETSHIPFRTISPKPTSVPDLKQHKKTTKTHSPKKTPDNHTITTPSRSDDFLSSHFFRMSAGYSVSLYELTQIRAINTDVQYENMTPDIITLQNNIIYAKTTGLAVIKIYCGYFTTSCTVYVQDASYQ